MAAGCGRCQLQGSLARRHSARCSSHHKQNDHRQNAAKHAACSSFALPIPPRPPPPKQQSHDRTMRCDIHSAVDDLPMPTMEHPQSHAASAKVAVTSPSSTCFFRELMPLLMSLVVHNDLVRCAPPHRCGRTTCTGIAQSGRSDCQLSPWCAKLLWKRRMHQNRCKRWNGLHPVADTLTLEAFRGAAATASAPSNVG